MMQGKLETVPSQAEGDARAIRHLKEAIASGKHWYMALLEAIGLWTSIEEDYNERHYCYLIDGEAFDWLLLAERLCEQVDSPIAEEELINLLFFDKPPIELPKGAFKRLIGAAKYKAYLNYLYGILVEQALILTAVNEIRKQQRSLGLNKDRDTIDKAHQYIYGASQEALLELFRKEKKRRQRKTVSLTELKEFTYWLFKYRVKKGDKARVASDTKKALAYLRQLMLERHFGS